METRRRAARHTRYARRFIAGPLIILLAGFIHPGVLQAQDTCEGVLGEAEAHYVTGAFSDAINVLAPCIRSFPAGTERDRSAYRLLALAYLRNGEIEESRLVIVELFERNPGYEADPVADPPAYVSLVNLVREESGIRSTATSGGGTGSGGGGGASPPRTWLRSPRTWLLVAGGSAVVTALVVLGTSGGGGGGGDSNGLPMPPAFP